MACFFGALLTMASISQNRRADLLPDFRNLGVVLRILVAVSVLSFIAAALQVQSWAGMLDRWFAISALVQPMVILSLMILGLLTGWLRNIDYPVAVASIILVECVIAATLVATTSALFGSESWDMARTLIFTVATTIALLGYFNLRNRALSPALTEARLQALQARIRPHFLFNSINAVLSLVRSEPRRAEAALEDMADLFRVLMADNRDLVPLEAEVELCRQYLDLEKLRLGERLQVEWHVDNMPRDTLIPPLLLQPLLENAVYHGIEPSVEPGVVSINIYASRDQLHMVLRNPYRKEGSHHAGNKMALGNIRERLSLHFDAEAALQTRVGDSQYEVHITLPRVKERP
jgi:two-component system, LytTR family, sensor histidine kinase AlgZ